MNKIPAFIINIDKFQLKKRIIQLKLQIIVESGML